MAEQKTYIAGTVTAYGAAVKGGYTGTYEEFCAQQAAFAENAAQVAADRQAVEAAAETFTGTTVPAATQAIQTAGAAQVDAVDQEGETQRGLLQSAGEGAVSDVQAAGRDQIAAVQQAGSDQVGLVTAEGTQQVSNVGTEGQTQIAAVQAKGTEVIESIPEDYTELTEDVAAVQKSVSDLQNNTKAGLYGVKWDRLTNMLTRLGEAAGITTDTTNFCHKGTINANYSNPFDSIYPWSEMVVCDVSLTKYRSGNYTLKECITAVYGDPDFTYIGSNTNFVGRYRPDFWYKSEEDSSGNVSFWISQWERDGFIYAPEAIDGISFCIDDGNGGVTAGSDIPLTNISVANIHAKAKTSGFTLQDIYSIDAQIMLYLVEYANMNSQSAIGDGCSSCYRENDADAISNVSVSGGKTTFTITDSAMAAYMEVGAQFDIGATKGAVTYRGILESYTADGSTYTITLDRELAVSNGMIASVHGFSACELNKLSSSIGNASGYIGTNGKANAFYRGALLYANRYSYVLGIYRQQNTNHLWLCGDGYDPDDYDALNTSVHTDTGVALPDLETAAWVTVGGNAQRIPGLGAFMATGTSSGSSASPVGDQQYVPLATTGNTVLLFGCIAASGWLCGVFGGYWSFGSGYSHWSAAGLPILKKSL